MVSDLYIESESLYKYVRYYCGLLNTITVFHLVVHASTASIICNATLNQVCNVILTFVHLLKCKNSACYNKVTALI